MAVPRRHPPHQILSSIRHILSLPVVCFDFRLLYRAGCLYIHFCHYSFLHGLYYASYGMAFACVEGTITSWYESLTGGFLILLFVIYFVCRSLRLRRIYLLNGLQARLNDSTLNMSNLFMNDLFAAQIQIHIFCSYTIYRLLTVPRRETLPQFTIYVCPCNTSPSLLLLHLTTTCTHGSFKRYVLLLNCIVIWAPGLNYCE